MIHFKGLNTLRFFSALAIIVYHGTLSLQGSLPEAARMFLHNLPLGVDFFFLISGFLIVFLLLEEKEKYQRIQLGNFYIRRILRIFPLYYLVVGLAYWQYHYSNPEIDFSKYLYFWGNFWMIGTDKWTVSTLNPLWSLCIEEHFYLITPLLVALLPRPQIRYLFWSILLLSIGFRAWFTLTEPNNWMTIYCHTLSRADVIAIGGLLACRHQANPIRISLPRQWLYGALAYLVLLCAALDTADYTTLFFATAKKYLFIAPLVFIFVFVLFHTDNPKAEHPVLSYLGKISFGLYMYHSPVADALWQIPFFQQHHLLKTGLLLLLTIGVAALSYELFERQLLKLKRRFEVVPTQAAAAGN